MNDFFKNEISQDLFLGGQLSILQPITGYRAATDPVLLAAACPAKNSDEVIDLLVRKKVYANMEETMAEEYESCVDMGSDPDDYETLLADEARKADIMEVNRMKENKIRRQYMKTLDQQIEDLKFDQE